MHHFPPTSYRCGLLYCLGHKLYQAAFRQSVLNISLLCTKLCEISRLRCPKQIHRRWTILLYGTELLGSAISTIHPTLFHTLICKYLHMCMVKPISITGKITQPSKFITLLNGSTYIRQMVSIQMTIQAIKRLKI